MYWTKRIDELAGAVVQPAGTAAWYSSKVTVPWAADTAGIAPVSSRAHAARRLPVGVIAKM
jgi:hypothetical protein